MKKLIDIQVVGAAIAASVLGIFYIFAMLSDAVAQVELARYVGTRSASRAGTVAVVGDVNGDGKQDFAITEQDHPQLRARVSVYSGASGLVLYTVESGRRYDFFGDAIAPAGDVNHDGFNDFAIGAANYGFLENYAATGAVFVFSGRDGSLLRRILPPTSSQQFGFSIAGGSDLNGDKVPDLVVGAPHWTAPTVYFISGADSKLLDKVSGADLSSFGRSIDVIGDLDADGVSEVAVGAESSSHQGISGQVQVLSGRTRGVLATIDNTVVGTTGFGGKVSRLGDVDRDGVTDFIVQSSNGTGALHVISGRSFTPIWGRIGQSSEDNFGASLAPLGDIDQDGSVDILVGAPENFITRLDSRRPGYVQGLSGRTGGVLFTIQGPAVSVPNTYQPAFGQSIGVLGDLNRNGVPEIIVGSPLASISAATPFEGSATLFSLADFGFFGQGCGRSSAPTISHYLPPQIGQPLPLGGYATPNSTGSVVLSVGVSGPHAIGGMCSILVPLDRVLITAQVRTDSTGWWSGTVLLPGNPLLVGKTLSAQVVFASPLGLEMSDGLYMRVF